MTTLLPLALGVRRRPDAGAAAKRERLPSKTETDKVLARDAYTCRCCGFQSKRYQRVVPSSLLPAQDASSRGDDFVTVCTFCEAALSLDRIGVSFAGHLIWLPELTQAELNQAAHALYVAKASSDETLKKAAMRTLDVLMARRSEAKKRLGTDDPTVLATAMLELVPANEAAQVKTRLDGVRLLPLERYMVRVRGQDTDVFSQMVSYWTSSEGPYAATPVAQWTELFQTISAK